MLKFFDPQSKVQKNREILRETDVRMAKYSRRGLVSNFLVYLLCLVDGRFVQTHMTLASILTIGLLITTLLRAYFLFRFEALYPHAPARWRNHYFVATLSGACWWGLIMACMTLSLDMQYEAPLLWLYTVVFFSTTAHAFAPYERFLTYYQFVSLVPAAICAFFIGGFIGVVYGAVLLFFFWILNHQCHLMADNYWTRLEANYILARKTESLEEERRDTRASVQLSMDYMTLLKAELKSLLKARRKAQRDGDASPNLRTNDDNAVDSANADGAKKVAKSKSGRNGNTDRSSDPSIGHPLKRPKLQQLYKNVSDFQQIMVKQLILEPRTFNVRQQLQSLITLYVDDAESRGVRLVPVISPVIPLRLYGDAGRLSQIVHILLLSTLQQTENEIIFIDVDFVRSVEEAGELNINIHRQKPHSRKLFFQDQTEEPITLDLNLALGIGLADAMGGVLEISENRSMGAQLSFSAGFEVKAQAGQVDYYNSFYRDKKILLVDDNPRFLDIKRQELSLLGLTVKTETDFKKAMVALESAVAEGWPYSYLVYDVHVGDESAHAFCQVVAEHCDMKSISQFLICSSETKASKTIRTLLPQPNIYAVNKPLGVFEFEMAIHSLTVNGDEYAQERNTDGISILVFAPTESHDVDKLLARFGFSTQLLEDEKQLAKAIATTTADLAVIVVDGAQDSGLESSEDSRYDATPTEYLSAIASFRTAESRHGCEFHMPIIAVGQLAFEQVAYEFGADQYLLTHSANCLVEESVRFWAGVSKQNVDVL